MPPHHAADPADRLSRLLDAVLLVASDLSLGTTLERIVRAAGEIAGARYAALGVLGPGGELADFITAGMDEATIAGIDHRPEGLGLLGTLIVEPVPLRIPEIARDPRSAGFPAGHPPMGAFLGVPIVVRDRVFGNLYLTDKVDGDAFTAEDEALVVALAAAAGVAIENARLHRRIQEYAVVEDRDRIARDLHDTVIQRLFATAMTLQAIARTTDPDTGTRILAAVDELDETIREIRGTIFALQHTPGASLHRELQVLMSELTPALGFRPDLVVEGPIDTVVPEAVGDQLLACAREALTNVARHARATRVEVVVVAGADLALRVTDDGIGPVGDPREGHGNGTRNLAHRAEQLGGSVEIDRLLSGGTVVDWRVPLAT
ncbi:MAG: GAF domain-containing sensor histidine kinase [Actinomycetes bacterium]